MPFYCHVHLIRSYFPWLLSSRGKSLFHSFRESNVACRYNKSYSIKSYDINRQAHCAHVRNLVEVQVRWEESRWRY